MSLRRRQCIFWQPRQSPPLYSRSAAKICWSQ